MTDPFHSLFDSVHYYLAFLQSPLTETAIFIVTCLDLSHYLVNILSVQSRKYSI